MMKTHFPSSSLSLPSCHLPMAGILDGGGGNAFDVRSGLETPSTLPDRMAAGPALATTGTRSVMGKEKTQERAKCKFLDLLSFLLSIGYATYLLHQGEDQSIPV